MISLEAQFLMVHTDVAVYENMPVPQLAEKLYRMRIGGLPVINESKKYCGMVTVADIFQGLKVARSVFGKKALWISLYLTQNKIIRVKDIYRREKVSIRRDAPVEQIIDLMLKKDLYAVPVTNEGETTFYGVIGRYEITRVIFQSPDGLEDTPWVPTQDA
ncbi:MAG: CBS domain-containing protein [Candidatus Omnitrophota bacterium]|jgi:CBS domain-containing protein